jgi:hypothetical protein
MHTMPDKTLDWWHILLCSQSLVLSCDGLEMKTRPIQRDLLVLVVDFYSRMYSIYWDRQYCNGAEAWSVTWCSVCTGCSGSWWSSPGARCSYPPLPWNHITQQYYLRLKRLSRALHQPLFVCPWQPNLAAGQANLQSNLPNGQPNI